MQSDEKPVALSWNEAYQRYNHNLFRQLVFIHRHLHASLTERLQQDGYPDFRMSFIDVIPYLSPEGIRLADLVEIHQLPKASLARLINTIHHQGFIEKVPDPHDQRANTLFITDKGLELLGKAYVHIVATADSFREMMGSAAFQEFCGVVSDIFSSLGLSYPPTEHYFNTDPDRSPEARLQIELNALTRYVDLRVLVANQAAGFDDLQASHRTVLAQISQQGTRASEIALREGISKQSISDISHVLMQKKYLRRIKDPDDKRAHRLVFAERGESMIIQTMEELKALEREITSAVGESKMKSLREQSERLWFLLEGENPEEYLDKNLKVLTPIIGPMLKKLLLQLQTDHAEIAQQVFYREDGQYRLRVEFLKHLQTYRLK